MVACLAVWPGPRLHDRPCEPSAGLLHHIGTCGARILSTLVSDPPPLEPSRHPFATHMMVKGVRTTSCPREVLLPLLVLLDGSHLHKIQTAIHSLSSLSQ